MLRGFALVGSSSSGPTLDAVPQYRTMPVMDRKLVTRAELEAYRARWQAVNQLEIEEMRRTPISLRLKQANVLFRLAQSMRLHHAMDDPEIERVRARWVKLKAGYP